MQEKNTHDLQVCKVSWIYACNFLIGPPIQELQAQKQANRAEDSEKNRAFRRKWCLPVGSHSSNENLTSASVGRKKAKPNKTLEGFPKWKQQSKFLVASQLWNANHYGNGAGVLLKVRDYLKTVIFFFFFFNHSYTAGHAQGSKTAWIITPMEAIQTFTA